MDNASSGQDGQPGLPRTVRPLAFARRADPALSPTHHTPALVTDIDPNGGLSPRALGLADEHDACALVAIVNKTATPTHDNVTRALDALVTMAHRAGAIDGEGDGCGVMVDLPRALWARRLDGSGQNPTLTERPDFFVGHILIERHAPGDATLAQVVARFEAAGFQVLMARQGETDATALGPRARAEEPRFYQIAGVSKDSDAPDVGTQEARLFHLQTELERTLPLLFASLSCRTAVYKLRGAPDTLDRYFPDLRNPLMASVATLGHSRYCTNTVSSFFRVQPFSILGHNGEINTWARLDQEARMLGAKLVAGGSDSQSLNRTVETLIHDYGYGLLEAMEIAFPPIVNEIKQLEPHLQNLYVFLRQAFGPFAQGPAGIIARNGDECVFAVDALGLRPLWQGELADVYFFGSEKGIFDIADMVADPRPLSPGEKAYVTLAHDGATVWPYAAAQQETLRRLETRLVIPKDSAKLIAFSQPPVMLPGDDSALKLLPETHVAGTNSAQTETLMAALAWTGDDIHYVEALADTGNEPIGSLGYDGPLAALAKERRNLTDFFKENVAVVTNPAIDREREIEHFSTRVVIGARPSLAAHPAKSKARPNRMVELSSPILLGGHFGNTAPLSAESYAAVARAAETYLIEEMAEFVTQNGFRPEAICVIQSAYREGESLTDALNRMTAVAAEGIENGARMVLVDDTEALLGEKLWLDPHLTVAALDENLRNWQAAPVRTSTGPLNSVRPPYRNLRREASLILRAGSLRNLHDIILAYSCGADAINPYMMIEVAASEAVSKATDEAERDGMARKRVANLVEGLKKGLEKVISTMGIHELRGYGRLCASIGLKPEVARYFGPRAYAGSNAGGYGWAAMVEDAQARRRLLRGETEAKMPRDYRFYPKLWKTAGASAATGGAPAYEKYEALLAQLEEEQPVALRHLLDIAPPVADPVPPEEVDISVERHALPFAISSMSYGSQGETAYRAYAEAGSRLGMVALNGEGGEIKDILGKYYDTRGVQIASGRFGVNIELLNSAHLLEIKIGQGAKPGEGGHLPGSKVTPKVAAARLATPKVDLISPSNNHDIYSIEDLAQFIAELKTANPDARVAVKVPVVAGIGTIATGIAKAGADVVTLSGFDGGTGAARTHALKYVGLPIEVGVMEAHQALVAAGLRDSVELWADGGLKGAKDVLKLVCMGANRVGFATLAMVAIGCTICRACQKDTCHVGIATQIESVEEAHERGLKRFIPQDEDRAANQLVTLFTAMGDHLRRMVGQMGFHRLQDLVGRADLLAQVRGLELADLREFITADPAYVQHMAARATDTAALAAHDPERWAAICHPCALPPHAATTGQTTRRITADVMARLTAGQDHAPVEGGSITYAGHHLGSVDRAVGTHLAGAMLRGGWGGGPGFTRNFMHGIGGSATEEPRRGEEVAVLDLNSGSIPGNGLAAFNSRALKIVVQGGAQDGVGKGSLGGSVVVLKGKNGRGERIDGSVGKSFGYGAQRGLFIIQGNADSRLGIRLSGADLVVGGTITEPIDDNLGYIGTRANLKGFAFEYMTNGRGLVLGDPGPWVCSGMTGGTVYLRLQPEMGLDIAALKRRLAKGAKVGMSRLNDGDKAAVRDLLTAYRTELAASGQSDAAASLDPLLAEPDAHFIKVQPVNMQVDPSISTE